ncbi:MULTISPECIES: urease accessory protein UreD [unclassified Pseudofrankia]|uniref:urease accessory protein UreD n=1 Tax=unclassified Pseudofrankia TaxID=2994372 RepID=UPI0008DA6D15|nr:MULTISPECIES: urease accessory protein UreD [unclassified Pseudofrankia]MDT3438890.1 urease accessory protein UreD [Pseudofrankia sp. BMG5.37]OHV74819.1 urease accessory protein UreD [Pseudofrankia sp. BMG5.36]
MSAGLDRGVVRAHEVRAHAVLRVEAGPDGSARVVEARSAVPLVLRHTDTATPRRPPGQESAAPVERGVRDVLELTPPALPTVTVHLVGAAAGPLAGDHLRLDVSVGAGVRLVLRSVAATLAMPGHGPGPSVMEIHADVAAGGALDLLPEPTVAVRGCRHRMVGRAVVAAGGWLRWREEVLLGRFGEPSGHLETDLRVDIRTPAGDRALLRQQLPLGPDVPGLTGAALIGAARAVGSLLVAAPAAVTPPRATSLGGRPEGGRDGDGGGRTGGLGPAGLGVPASVTPPVVPGAAGLPGGSAVLPLAGPGVLVTALAADAVTLRRHLGP